jgi:hypothetical protein
MVKTVRLRSRSYLVFLYPHGQRIRLPHTQQTRSQYGPQGHR